MVESSLEKRCRDILSEKWLTKTGKVVPDVKSIQLAGGGREFTATMLYADLAASTELTMSYGNTVVAKVIKCFLACASSLITRNGGQIRSFDGDRVMGVFIGKSPNTLAARCGLQINYAVQSIVQPLIVGQFESLRNADYQLRHAVGIDSSRVLSVRAGIRDTNDLVWVGRAPNIAAKLSGLRSAKYRTFVTDSVYEAIDVESRLDGKRNNMWTRLTWEDEPNIPVYGSGYLWRPS